MKKYSLSIFLLIIINLVTNISYAANTAQTQRQSSSRQSQDWGLGNVLSELTGDVPQQGPGQTQDLDLGRVLSKLELKLRTNPKEEQDLCKTTVNFPSRHDICQGNLNTPRYEMPQLGGKPRSQKSLASKLIKAKALVPNQFGGVDLSSEFIDYLSDSGVKVSHGLKNSGELKATQKDIVGSKVVSIWAALRANPNWTKELIEQCSGKSINSKTAGITAPIFISNDNYILDGHHRWAAIVGAYDAFAKNVQPQMCVNIIDMPISQLLHEARAFAKVYGIPQEAGIIKK